VTQRSGQLHLNAFLLDVGHHEAAWRLPESNPLAGTDIEHFKNLARIAERGKLDSLFLADVPALWGSFEQRPNAVFEPTLLLTALAGATQHIGLIATASTSYNEPYNLARRFATLDHVSSGRAGWNIVTTAGEDAARNFNLDALPAHADRYARAAEFVELSLKLWDSWDVDAVVADKARGVWGDSAKLHPPRHAGEHYRVQGALNVPRPPQGHPLLVQAGSSATGMHFAARYAEAVFTAQQTLEEGQRFYTDLKAQARKLGRHPDSLKILPGIVPVLGGTEREAQARQAELDALISPEYARERLATVLGVEPERLALDAELPTDLPPLAKIEGAKSRFALVIDLARRERLTVRQLLAKLGGGRGHRTVVGTPEQIADAIAQWWNHCAADGFNVMPPVLPSGLTAFVDEVVPILQKRRLFRREYSGQTLREHYGLRRPNSVHVQPAAAARVEHARPAHPGA
jgi:FMN-dependent oxidoreductase (nitrilotriacetate monooxygenase family)